MVRKLLHIQNMDFTENNSSHGNDRKGNKMNIWNTTIHKHTNILPITLVSSKSYDNNLHSYISCYFLYHLLKQCSIQLLLQCGDFISFNTWRYSLSDYSHHLMADQYYTLHNITLHNTLNYVHSVHYVTNIFSRIALLSRYF